MTESRAQMVCEFFMAMHPPTVTFQDKGLAVNKKGKPYLYDSPELKAAKSKLLGHLGKHRPERMLKGPIRLLQKWCFYSDEEPEGSYKTTKPDNDNASKALKDCMTELGFWGDDAEVACDIIEKFWSKTPGIYVYAEELKDGHKR